MGNRGADWCPGQSVLRGKLLAQEEPRKNREICAWRRFGSVISLKGCELHRYEANYQHLDHVDYYDYGDYVRFGRVEKLTS